jgi:hypothetical protein
MWFNATSNMNLRFLQIAYKKFENICCLKRGFKNEEKGQCVMFVILTFLDTFNW